jgi:hypothetical protein
MQEMDSHYENGFGEINKSEISIPQPQPDPQHQTLLPSPTSNVKRATLDIVSLALALAVVLFPLVLISIGLLYLVFHYRILHNQVVSPQFQSIVEVDEPNVYYITVSSTTFVLLASYSSTFAHIMIGFIMTLLAYPISQRFIQHSRARAIQRLPTPYQFALVLGCLEGNFMSLWRWLGHCCGRILGKAAGTLGSAGFVLLVVNVITYDFGP